MMRPLAAPVSHRCPFLLRVIGREPGEQPCADASAQDGSPDDNCLGRVMCLMVMSFHLEELLALGSTVEFIESYGIFLLP